MSTNNNDDTQNKKIQLVLGILTIILGGGILVPLINHWIHKPTTYTGTVVNEKDDPIVGAEVTLKYQNFQTKSGEKGVYYIPLVEVPESAYISAKAEGYKEDGLNISFASQVIPPIKLHSLPKCPNSSMELVLERSEIKVNEMTKARPPQGFTDGKFKSEDEEIARVTLEGTIIGRKRGRASIIGTGKNRNGAVDCKFLSKILTVNDQAPVPTERVPAARSVAKPQANQGQQLARLSAKYQGEIKVAPEDATESGSVKRSAGNKYNLFIAYPPQKIDVRVFSKKHSVDFEVRRKDQILGRTVSYPSARTWSGTVSEKGYYEIIVFTEQEASQEYTIYVFIQGK